MQYEELHKRYGPHLSQRIARELTESELSAITIEQLYDYLELRAEAAHDAYAAVLAACARNREVRHGLAEILAQQDSLAKNWRAAEELAYLVVIAEDVSAAARAS